MSGNVCCNKTENMTNAHMGLSSSFSIFSQINISNSSFY